MAEPGRKQIQKSLFIDIIMGLIFVLLLIVGLWITWVYYFRGPIDIVTDKDKLQVEQQMLAQAGEDYSSHFHNLDTAVLAGIKTGSTCLVCHGDYPHAKGRKVRSLFNAHAWFIACEVCHLKFEDGVEIEYRWFDNDSGLELTKLEGKDGNYGATIVPIKYEFWTAKRLDTPQNEDFINEYLQSEALFSDDQKKMAMERVHETLTKKPVYCDQCHINDGIFNFTDLLYSPQSTIHLESIDMGAMAKTYEEFHFPTLFDQ